MHGSMNIKSCYSVVICLVLCYFVLFYVILCCSMLFCVVLCYFVLFYVILCCSMYCWCVNVYCTTATGCQTNCSWQITYIILFWYSYERASQCNFKLQPTRYNVSWFIYFWRHSTCFRRFLRPSSGAHNCTYSFRYCQPILLLADTVEELELHLFHSSS